MKIQNLKQFIKEVKEFLDELEGDFNKKDLQEALEFMKNYAPTLDSSSFYENRWQRLLKNELKTKHNKNE